MTTRKLLIGLTTAGVLSAGLGPTAGIAQADMRVLTVTLLGGEKLIVKVDVPPGVPLNQVTIPGVTVPIIAIVDGGPADTELRPPTPTPPPVATTPAKPAPAKTTPAPTTTSKAPATKTSTSATPTTTSPAPTATGPAATSTAPAPTDTTPAPEQGDTPEAGEQESQDTTGKAKAGATASEAEAKAKDKAARKAADAASDALVLEAKDAAEATGGNPDGSDGAPQPADPGYSFALPGPAAIGVPNFFISKFQIPPFLLPIYQAAGIQYGVRWEILAAINEIETDYGRNLNVSTAGALGWMQFMPATWKQYGVDANDDASKDPYNPVDAIFAAARYLKAAGAEQDVRKALFAYNHADWYVESVLLRARLIGGLPADLVGSLSGLTQGHFPVHAAARYAGASVAKNRKVTKGNAANPVDSASRRTGVNVYAKAGSPVIAVQDGTIVKVGTSKRLGRFVQLRDVYGNTYTYGNLKKVSEVVPVPKPTATSKAALKQQLAEPKADPKPTAAASAGEQVARKSAAAKPKAAATSARDAVTTTAARAKERLFAHPTRKVPAASGGRDQVLQTKTVAPGEDPFKEYFTEAYGLKREDVTLKPLKKGSRVIAGTILGRIGTTSSKKAPHLKFEIRPAGKDAPRIDPKPILDGWKLLESTAIYRAAGKNPFFGSDAKNPSIGQILLLSKEALQRRVLADPRVTLYEGGARDVAAGSIDRRVLATLEFLSASGLKPTVTSLRSGHGYYTASGNVSEHSSGTAVDIAQINGIPIAGHQGDGSITDLTIRRLLTLQGTMKPHQIISLMQFTGADNTLSMPDHADHIHVGFRPLSANGKLGRQLGAVLKPSQWSKLIDRLGSIENPEVLTSPSKAAIDVKPTAGSKSGD